MVMVVNCNRPSEGAATGAEDDAWRRSGREVHLSEDTEVAIELGEISALAGGAGDHAAVGARDHAAVGERSRAALYHDHAAVRVRGVCGWRKVSQGRNLHHQRLTLPTLRASGDSASK
jgi:hypothetical protein